MGIGILLGSVWANVSWGSYWSWDPKEVWALVAFMVYGAAFHRRTLPWLRRPLGGAQIVEVRDGYARAEMTVTCEHLNGGGACQGGALFTLADLALAAVMNSGGRLTLARKLSLFFCVR